MRTVTTVPAGTVGPDADELLDAGAEAPDAGAADEPETVRPSTTFFTPDSQLAMRSTAAFPRSEFTLPDSVTKPSYQVTWVYRVFSQESSKRLAGISDKMLLPSLLSGPAAKARVRL